MAHRLAPLRPILRLVARDRAIGIHQEAGVARLREDGVGRGFFVRTGAERDLFDLRAALDVPNRGVFFLEDHGLVAPRREGGRFFYFGLHPDRPGWRDGRARGGIEHAGAFGATEQNAAMVGAHDQAGRIGQPRKFFGNRCTAGDIPKTDVATTRSTQDPAGIVVKLALHHAAQIFHGSRIGRRSFRGEGRQGKQRHQQKDAVCASSLLHRVN